MNMLPMGRFYKITILFALIILLSSCQYAANNVNNIQITPTSLMVVSTLQSYATPITIFEYPDQVTDGRLLLSIELVDNACIQASKPLHIRLIFKNLTNKVLTIPTNFSIAVNRRGDGGNLIPFVSTVEGEEVLSLADYQMMDIFDTASNKVIEISPNQNIEFEVIYNLPQDLVIGEASDGYQLATPYPGRYFIRLVYSEQPSRDAVWSGLVGSNKLEFCLASS